MQLAALVVAAGLFGSTSAFAALDMLPGINCVTAHGAPGAAEKARPFSVLAGPAIILLLPVSDRNR